MGPDSAQRAGNLWQAIKNSDWELHSRTVGMATINNGSLKDDAALGTSLYLGLTTRSFHGFRLGAGGAFMFHLASTKLYEPDPATQMQNRYEQGLFDVENPTQKSDLNKLEKLFVRYEWRKSSIEAGRIGFTSPFINAQDGRLRPTAQQGILLQTGALKNLTLTGAWINAISPRSVVRWHTVAETFGLYPSGVAPDGAKSNYKGNIHTEGIALLNIVYKAPHHIRINAWNTYVDQVLNVALLEINHEAALKKSGWSCYQSLMLVREDAVWDGGNADPAKTYIPKGACANVISAQVGLRAVRWNNSLNYTRITKDGRFLMPREWGRDPFYTFMPRERNEGLGDVHAVMIRSAYTSSNKQYKGALSYGYYNLPDVKSYALNKYGQPSYHQVNLETGYVFKKALKGFEARAVFAWKLNAGELYDNPRFEYNKVNMVNCNFIIDYRL